MKPRQKSEHMAAKYYRDWAVKKDVSEDASKDLKQVVEQVLESLEVAGPSLALAFKWQRMLSDRPEKVWHQIRTLKRMCIDLGLTDEDFNPLDPQGDIEDAIRESESAPVI
jgi:hypothetical protein